MSEISIEEKQIVLRKWEARRMVARCHCHGPEPHKCYLVQVGGADPDWYKSRRCMCPCHVPCTCAHCKQNALSRNRRPTQ